MFVGASLVRRGCGCLENVSLSKLIGFNCLMVWLIDLKGEDLFLDDVIEAYFENFFDPTFTKKFLKARFSAC